MTEPVANGPVHSEEADVPEFEVRARNRGFDGFDAETEGAWNGPFCFVQAADTQFGMIDSYVNRNHKNPSWQEEIRLTRRAVQAVNRIRPRPRFFIVCGDLVDAMPGVSYKDAQIADFKRVFAELDPAIRVVCVCGNHDIGDIPTSGAIEHYRRRFGDEYFSFWVGGCKFIVINSQLYHDSSQVPNYKREHDIWLDRELSPALRPWRHLVAFQHIPPFVSHPDEDPVEVPGNDALKFNFANRKVRAEFLAKIKSAGIRYLFCGHYHRNAGGRDGPLEVVVTSAVGCQLGDDTHGVRLVRVYADRVEHQYYGLDELPEHIDFEV